MGILWLVLSVASGTYVRHFRRPHVAVNTKESSLAADTDDQGEVLLCRMDSLQVRLDRNTNTRTLTFGDGSTEARRLMQTAIRCKGRAPDSCGNPNNMSLQELKAHPPSAGCDLDPQGCPCTFDMEDLPPLDREYKFIYEHIRSGKVAGLNIDGMAEASHGDFFGHEAGASARVLLVGLGGGMLPQYLIQHTVLQVDAVELNGDVIKVARAFFGLPESEKSGQLSVIEGDGLAVVKAKAPETYGAAIVDCAGADRIPLNCRSREFIDALYWAIRPGGEVLQNVVTGHPDHQVDALVKKDLQELLAAYREVFGKKAGLAMKNENGWTQNSVIVAKKQS